MARELVSLSRTLHGLYLDEEQDMRLPDRVEVVCQYCKDIVRIGRLKGRNGKCPDCRREKWSIVVTYVDEDDHLMGNTIGAISATTTGIGWSQWSMASSSQTVPDVPAAFIDSLASNKKKLAQSVADYLRIRQQGERRADGAIHCKKCEALFTPHSGTIWEERGYCSKMCGFREIEMSDKKSADEASLHDKIAMTCPNGHAFEVLATYSGCVRRCPSCEEKCNVP